MPIHSPFLNYFISVYKHGSIRLAAKNLNISSSAVNRQILKIEDELGAKLFDRTSAGLQPTPAGELLALHVQRTLSDAEQTLTQIADQQNTGRSVIRITGQESVISRFLPPALLQLHAKYPEISTAFKAASGSQLQDLLRSDRADIALAFDPEPSADIDVIHTLTLPVGAVLSINHPLANHEHVTLNDSVSFPIVLPDRSWPLRATLDKEIEGAGLQPNVITSSNSVEFLKMMVDHDLGLGFQTVVGIETQVEQGELRHIPLRASTWVTQQFALCMHSDKLITPDLDHMLSLLINRLSQYDQPLVRM